MASEDDIEDFYGRVIGMPKLVTKWLRESVEHKDWEIEMRLTNE